MADNNHTVAKCFITGLATFMLSFVVFCTINTVSCNISLNKGIELGRIQEAKEVSRAAGIDSNNIYHNYYTRSDYFVCYFYPHNYNKLCETSRELKVK